VGQNEILSSQSARNIGAYVDSTLNMNLRINSTVRSCYFQLRATAKMRKYVSHFLITKLCHVFITSRLNNLNSLLVNIPNRMLHKLQLVQNSTARVILKLSRKGNITPALIERHWLPFPQRIHYKTLLLVYKSSPRHNIV